MLERTRRRRFKKAPRSSGGAEVAISSADAGSPKMAAEAATPAGARAAKAEMEPAGQRRRGPVADQRPAASAAATSRRGQRPGRTLRATTLAPTRSQQSIVVAAVGAAGRKLLPQRACASHVAMQRQGGWGRTPETLDEVSWPCPRNAVGGDRSRGADDLRDDGLRALRGNDGANGVDDQIHDERSTQSKRPSGGPDLRPPPWSCR